MIEELDYRGDVEGNPSKQLLSVELDRLEFVTCGWWE
jgi:hypothetical protein